MNIVCKASNMGCDVRCAVCGQSFLVYWTYLSPGERIRQHAEVLAALRGQHAAGLDAQVHPRENFVVDFADFEPIAKMMPPTPAAHSGAHAVAA